MKGYDVYTSDRFDKEVDKLPRDENIRIENMLNKLINNPYAGDQLQIRSLREKRLEEKRIYYLVFEDLEAVFVIAIGGKKGQQKMINFIVDNINEYKDELREKIQSGDSSYSSSS